MVSRYGMALICLAAILPTLLGCTPRQPLSTASDSSGVPAQQPGVTTPTTENIQAKYERIKDAGWAFVKAHAQGQIGTAMSFMSHGAAGIYRENTDAYIYGTGSPPAGAEVKYYPGNVTTESSSASFRFTIEYLDPAARRWLKWKDRKLILVEESSIYKVTDCVDR